MTLPEADKPVHVRHEKYERLIARAQEAPSATTIVAHPCDETSLRGAVEAAEAGIIVPILVGPKAKIEKVARETLDAEANRERRSVISASESRVPVYVVPTNEELMIARHTLELLSGQHAL